MVFRGTPQQPITPDKSSAVNIKGTVTMKPTATDRNVAQSDTTVTNYNDGNVDHRVRDTVAWSANLGQSRDREGAPLRTPAVDLTALMREHISYVHD